MYSKAMGFVDELALELFVVAFVGFLMDYVILGMYKDYRARYISKSNSKVSIESRLGDSIFMFAALALFILVMGFYGEMTWTCLVLMTFYSMILSSYLG
ncbi:MAG: hypothetical protein BJBARM5_0187 [Candidatus Parvarchaeum acidophilus ARMAN-5]|uniref:Uncharacterized protein n=1 Tax=Candidatus Parvarchaeum acidophilus ARMAN-5 TaxID=662762 RepID=D6GUP2_PARA5|nr:MAG: hypothetical protein BJBARM5_0187 [Candidatus Parvarchaeum acidophilus ARMAN-5]